MGLHRFYLGKHWSGGLQLAAAVAGYFWLERSCAGLLALTNLEDVQAWVEIHGAPLGPLLFVALAGLAPVFDGVRLAAGKFRDARGNLVTEWT